MLSEAQTRSGTTEILTVGGQSSVLAAVTRKAVAAFTDPSSPSHAYYTAPLVEALLSAIAPLSASGTSAFIQIGVVPSILPLVSFLPLATAASPSLPSQPRPLPPASASKAPANAE